MDTFGTKILIVDDVTDNIQLAMNVLKEDGYSFSFATSGAEALELIEQQSPDLILLDVMMPNMNGFDVCKTLKAMPDRASIPIIFLTAKTDIDSIKNGFRVGGSDYVFKPFHPEELLARVKTHLELHQARKMLEQENLKLEFKAEVQAARMLTEVEESQREMLYLMTEMMESTSDETGKHIKRVAEYAKLFAQYTDSLTKDDETTLFHAAPMHDIGKLVIPHSILHKPAPLSEPEFEEMKTHTTKGMEFMQNSQRKLMKAAAIIAHQHHEKWNGSGYPRGLKGEEIHIYGRIVALADVFDALMHKRRYKEEWSLEDTVEYIKRHEGTQFDPALVKIFLDHLPEFAEIAKIA